MDAKYYNGEPTDPWPSVEDKAEPDACFYCEALPTESHHPRCPLHGPTIEADDVQFCDVCGCSYVTTCICEWEES